LHQGLLYTLHFLDVLNLVFLEAATSTVGQDANFVQVQVYPKLEPAWIVFALASSVSLQSSMVMLAAARVAPCLSKATDQMLHEINFVRPLGSNVSAVFNSVVHGEHLNKK
jgi:O-glycosyl hydrolase